MAQQYSTFQKMIQRMGFTPAGSWFFARTLHHIDRVVLRVTQGRKTLTSMLTGLPVVDVHTIGAKSGLVRKVPLLCVPDRANPTRFGLIASNHGQYRNPAWYYNLKAHPQVQCDIDGHTAVYVAHEAEGEEYDLFWQTAANVYGGFSVYKKRAAHRHIPIMVMEKVQD